MERLHELRRRLAFLFRRRQFECDLEEEMRFHLEMKARETGAAAAHRQFGNMTLLREDSRAAWGWAWLEALARDLRYGMRLYRRSPGFTAVAVLTLGLGLGVNIAIFMLLYNVILRPLPYPQPDRLVKVYVTFLSDQRGARDIGFSYPKFQDLQRLTSSFQSLAAYGRGTFDLADHPAERVRGEFVSSAYFRTLGVPAALGRTFLPQEDAVLRAGAVAVIADSLWKRRFGADPAVLGKEIRVETVSMSIVGVAPPGFTGETGRAELWLPITMAPLAGKSDNALTFRNWHWHMVVGRLKPGVTRAQAASEVAAVMHRVEQTAPTPGSRPTAYGAGVMPLAESRLEPNDRRGIFVLYGAVGFVLLIACGNLANLTRARMVGRQRETAMRLALGAGRGSLLRQFLAENLLLSLAGGAAGVLLASWTSRLLIYLRPADYASLPSYFRTLDPDSLRLTVPVLVFSLALSLASGLLFGLMPALRASRGDVYAALKQGTTGRRAGRGLGFRGVLLPAQMALAVVLLSGGVLMMRSFARLVNDPIGAEVHRVLAFEVSLPDYRYHNRQSRRAFLDRAAARLRELPAVESVALSDDVPALERDTVTDIAVANRPGSDFIGKHDVDPGFFSLFRIPLRAGRLFSEHDRQSKVLILSQHAAAILFPGRDPIGMHVNMGDDYAVVGVVGEVRYARQKQQLPLIGDAYVTPATGSPWVTARTAANPAGSIAAVRRVVAQLDPELPAYNLRTLEDQIYEENWGPRFAAVLLSFFAALALALAIVGIYGVFSYAVAARTREFGIRIATGARAADILFMVVREGALLCAIGLAAGIPAALATTRALGSLLYAVNSSDPLTYIATSIVLIATALGACLVPASRAARIDPVVALRCE